MGVYVLVPGAASSPWHWHRLDAELRRRGHDVVAVDLPCDDDAAGLPDYVDTVVDAIDGRTGVVLVADSFAGFTAPQVADRTPVDLLVLVNAMIPVPGERPGQWWANTGHAEARAAGVSDELASDDDEGADEDGVVRDFFHDLSPELTMEAVEHLREQSSTPFDDPWPLAAWPQAQTEILVSRHDRLFPLAFQREVARDRLGITPDEIDGGHFVALSRPEAVADRLERYRRV